MKDILSTGVGELLKTNNFNVEFLSKELISEECNALSLCVFSVSYDYNNVFLASYQDILQITFNLFSNIQVINLLKKSHDALDIKVGLLDSQGAEVTTVCSGCFKLDNLSIDSLVYSSNTIEIQVHAKFKRKEIENVERTTGSSKSIK